MKHIKSAFFPTLTSAFPFIFPTPLLLFFLMIKSSHASFGWYLFMVQSLSPSLNVQKERWFFWNKIMKFSASSHCPIFSADQHSFFRTNIFQLYVHFFVFLTLIGYLSLHTFNGLVWIRSITNIVTQYNRYNVSNFMGFHFQFFL